MTRLAASLAALALAPGGAAPMDDAAYWGVADRLQPRFDATWSEPAGAYRLGTGGVETAGNASMLTVHAIAALHGHQGPARQDARARRLVESLFAIPPYTPSVGPDRGKTWAQRHAPGWRTSMRTTSSGQHMAIDSEVVDALTYAWLARGALALPARSLELISTRVPAVARSRFWRWPAGAALNQFNWAARVYTADATITGRSKLLRRDLRRHLERFLRAGGRRRGAAGSLGPGLRFHYLPERPLTDPANVDSAEYGSIVASFTRFYPLARELGMAPPAKADRALLRRWLRRVISGYWTHGGYLSWETGLGFRRWHQTHKLALAQQALIGIATSPELTSARLRAWAKWILDRGLAFYERQAGRGGGVAPPFLFGVQVKSIPVANRELAAARTAANAARAVDAGLGSAPSRRPPPLYAFDPDTGRLAVSTPAYNTAVVPVSQGAFAYGGIELARLYDFEQEVAANIGGRPPAAFGLVVHDATGRRVLDTQTSRTSLPGRRPALRLTRAPAGAGVPPTTSARVAYAKPFTDLRVTGARSVGAFRARTSHRFTADFVETRWSLRRLAASGDRTVTVAFPSWGPGAVIEAVSRDGSRRTVDSGAMTLEELDHLYVRSLHSGYVIVPRRLPQGTTARVTLPDAQPSAPLPGPTLMLEIARGGEPDRVAMTARIAIARTPEAAAVTAAALRDAP